MRNEESAYFLTVDWCAQGHRGVFCNSQGGPYRKDEGPHTEEEMYEILGPFFLVLAPESQLFTVSELSEFSRWTPLAEYLGRFGVAQKQRKENNNEI